MDTIKAVLLSVALVSSTPNIIEYNAEPLDELTHVEEVKQEMTIHQLVDYYADKHGVSRNIMHFVVECESDYIVDVQSKHRYKNDNPKWGVKAGDQELSFGLSQIHLPSWGNITYEQAIDPHFALNFMAEKLSEGKGNLWTCYRKI